MAAAAAAYWLGDKQQVLAALVAETMCLTLQEELTEQSTIRGVMVQLLRLTIQRQDLAAGAAVHL